MNAPLNMSLVARTAETTIDSIFRITAARTPETVALIDPPNRETITGQAPRQFTYAQADRAIDAMAARLRQIGLPTGTVVGIQSPHVTESILTLLAVTRAGMVPALLPLLWRRSDCVAALSRAGARAIVTSGQVGDMDHARLALDIAAELFPIRVVCGFGCSRTEGIVPFDDCLRADDADVVPAGPYGETASTAVITFDMRADGPAPVLRDHGQLLAGGMLVQHRSAIETGAVLLSTIPATSFAGLTASVMPWLLSGGTLALHHPFEPDLLIRQIADLRCNVAIVPEALLPALMDAKAFDATDTLRTVVALWRSPERFAPASRWQADRPMLCDVVAFGEVGILAAMRPANGHPTGWPLGNVDITTHERAVTLAHVARTSSGTLGLGGVLAAAPLRQHDAEPSTTHESGPDIVDTGYPCRPTMDQRALVVTASPAGLVNVGGYRFSINDLQAQIRMIENNGVLAAFPHALCGYRLAGHAINFAAVRKTLEEAGSNPLICNAFHDRLPSSR